MTEREWFECADPDAMLEFLRGKVSDRKLRLFACACCRRTWSLLPDDLARRAVATAEQYADGHADLTELQSHYPPPDPDEDADAYASGKDAFWTAKASAYHTRYLATYCGPSSCPPGAQWRSASTPDRDRERAAQCALLRDLFNPFRPAAADPAWLAWEGGTVVRLARAIYEGRAFDTLPVLADALEDAGCSDPAILEHCRRPGPHARGCWPVDLLLGRE